MPAPAVVVAALCVFGLNPQLAKINGVTIDPVVTTKQTVLGLDGFFYQASVTHISWHIRQEIPVGHGRWRPYDVHQPEQLVAPDAYMRFFPGPCQRLAGRSVG